MFAYIPARGGSKRIPRKNIRLLDGQPILLRVIDMLAKVDSLSGICVSTDDPYIHDLVNNQGIAVTLDLRDKLLADDKTTFLELVEGDIPRYADYFHDQDILFTLATSALVAPEQYSFACQLFQSGAYKLVMAVTKYEMSPFFALAESKEGTLFPVFPEKFLKHTTEIPTAYYDSGCFYIFNRQSAQGITKFLDMVPVKGVELPYHIGIDVDNEQDWSRLEQEYMKKKSSDSMMGPRT
jgi:N-acylneuraminate cytidylyltransferase